MSVNRMLLLWLIAVVPANVWAEPIPKTSLPPTKIIIDVPIAETAGTQIALSADNAYIAGVRLEDNIHIVQLFDAKTGKLLKKITNGKRSANQIAFIDKNRLAVLWRRPNIYRDPDQLMSVSVIDVADSKTLSSFRIEGSEKNNLGLMQLSPLGDRVITYLERLEVWDLATGKRVHDLGVPFPDAPLRNSMSARRNMTLSSDAKWLCVSEPSGKFNVYDLSAGKQIGETRKPGNYQTVCVSGDGKNLYVSDDSGVTKYPINSVPDAPPPATQRVISREQVLVPGTTQPVTVTVTSSPNPPATTQSRREYGRLSPMYESPDGKRIAGLHGRELVILDVTGDQPKFERKFKVSSTNDIDLRWSADSRYVSTANWEATQIYDVATAKPLFGSAEHNEMILSVDAASNGREFMTVDVRAKINRWAFPDFKIIKSHEEGEVFRSGARTFQTSGFDQRTEVHYLPGDQEVVLEGMRHMRLTVEDFKPQMTSSFLGVPLANMTYSRDYNISAGLRREDPNEIAITNTSIPSQGKSLRADAAVKSIALNHDGTRLAAITGTTLEVADVEQGKTLATFELPKPLEGPNPPQLMITEDNQLLLAWSQSAIAAWRIPSRATTDPVKLLWSVGIDSLRKIRVSSNCGLIYALGTEAMHLVDAASGENVAILDLADQRPRLGVPVPKSSMYLLVSSVRRVVVYDMQALIITSQGGRDFSAMPGTTLLETADGSSGEAYAALIELNRRKELLPRIKQLLSDSKTTIGQAQRTKELVADLSAAESAVREKAHRELERLGADAGAAIKQAIPTATGETAERLASLMRLIGDEVSPIRNISERRIICAREVLSWQEDPATANLVHQINALLSGEAPTTTPPATKPAN